MDDMCLSCVCWCVSCMCCLCLVYVVSVLYAWCVSKGNHTGPNGRDSPTGHPDPAEQWDSVGTEVRHGGWEGVLGEIDVSGRVLDVLDGLCG